MRKIERFLIILTVLLCCGTIFLCGCNSSTDETLSVSGKVTGISDFSDIQILVNDKTINTKISDDGTFSISGLKGKDVISFEKEGYTFNSYTVGSSSTTDIEIVGLIRTYEVNINFDENLGSVNYQKSCKFKEDILITVEPNEHVEFLGIFDGDTLITNEKSYTLNVISDISYTAKFTKILYDISFTKNFSDAPASISHDSMSFGDVVRMIAEDNDDYVFVKWIVNNTEITDKTYDYAIDDTTPQIQAVFLKRLQKPNLIQNDGIISWDEIEDADVYKVYVDDVCVGTTTYTSFDLGKLNLYSGEIVIKVEADGAGFGASYSEMSTAYLRPYDTPSNVAIDITEDDVYLVFQRLLATDDYNIYVDGEKLNISKFPYSISDNIVRVNISKVFLESKIYKFSVTAIGTHPESEKSLEVSYTYTAVLDEPSVTLSGNNLSFSHENENVLFNISVNGVLVLENVEAGSYDITSNLDEGEEVSSITVVAILSGYKNSVKNIEVKGD